MSDSAATSTPITHPAVIDPSNTLFVICTAIFTALLTEGINWYMIYRKPEYKSLTQNIEMLQKKIERQKDGSAYSGIPAGGKSKSSDRKLQQLEAQLKQYNQDLSKTKMTGTFFVAVLMMAFMSFFSTSYAVSFLSNN